MGTNCFIEYLTEIHVCEKCSRETITRDQRMGDLQEKVDELKKEYLEKQKRRERWENYVKDANGGTKKKKIATKKKVSTDYDEWDRWEPEIDIEDYTGPQDPNDPQFAALAADLESREIERKKSAKLA